MAVPTHPVNMEMYGECGNKYGECGNKQLLEVGWDQAQESNTSLPEPESTPPSKKQQFNFGHPQELR